MQIGVKSDLKKLTKRLNNIQKKQIPFATAKALTAVGQKIKQAEIAEMKKVFDRPTRFTLNSLFLSTATKRRLKAVVWLRDWAPKGTPATKYLAPQIEGGRRRLKGFEVLLKRRGILPDGYYTVPGRRAKLDRSGNISKGLLNQILSYSQSQRDNAQNTKLSTGRRSTKARFIIFPPRGGMPGGVWQMKYGGLQPVLIFVKSPIYTKRFKFHEVADRTYRQHWRKEFNKALAKALETAR